LDRRCRCDRSPGLQGVRRRQRRGVSEIRGGRFEAPEGTPRSRNIVLEFKDYDTALACYHSPEYAAAKQLREGRSEANLIIIEGYDT
jgi:uncharacterized protein (DUF1330 family)